MREPEYCVLFSPNKGSVDVAVKFKVIDMGDGLHRGGGIRSGKMMPDEIIKLVSTDGLKFHDKMEFDEHLYEVYKYEIDPIKNKLTIFARIKH